MSFCPPKHDNDITLKNVSEFLAPTIDFGDVLIDQSDTPSSNSVNLPRHKLPQIHVKRMRPRKLEFHELSAEYKVLKARLAALQTKERRKSQPENQWYHKANRQAKRALRAIQENNRLIQAFEDQMKILRRLERKFKQIKQMNSCPNSLRLRIQHLNAIEESES